jgi:hypothetical protein
LARSRCQRRRSLAILAVDHNTTHEAMASYICVPRPLAPSQPHRCSLLRAAAAELSAPTTCLLVFVMNSSFAAIHFDCTYCPIRYVGGSFLHTELCKMSCNRLQPAATLRLPTHTQTQTDAVVGGCCVASIHWFTRLPHACCCLHWFQVQNSNSDQEAVCKKQVACRWLSHTCVASMPGRALSCR